MRKPFFCICKNKRQHAVSTFVFATRIVQSLYFLNTKFQASSHLLWLYSPVCAGSGRKPRRPVFSQRCSNISHLMDNELLLREATCIFLLRVRNDVQCLYRDPSVYPITICIVFNFLHFFLNYFK